MCVQQCCGCAAFDCAGLSRSQSSLFDGRVECWLEMVSTNILGTAMMTRAALQVGWAWLLCTLLTVGVYAGSAVSSGTVLQLPSRTALGPASERPCTGMIVSRLKLLPSRVDNELKLTLWCLVVYRPLCVCRTCSSAAPGDTSSTTVGVRAPPHTAPDQMGQVLRRRTACPPPIAGACTGWSILASCTASPYD